MDKFDFCGEDVQEWPYSLNGGDAKYCFYKFDSTGKRVPSNNAQLVRKVLICKKSINLHIKFYAEGLNDNYSFFTVNELLKEFINPPQWVERAIRSQSYKIWKTQN